MADLVDIQNYLVTTVSGALYLTGVTNPSVTGTPIAVYAGWPVKAQLDIDIAANKTHVSIFTGSGERNTTRYPMEWKDTNVAVATLVLTVSGKTVTVSGTVSVPQNCIVIVNGKAYSYAVQSADTLTTIATGVAALIAGATSSGAVVTIPSANSLTTAISTQGTSVKEIRRQERVFQITVWAPTPTLRDTVAQTIDLAIAQIERFTLPDQTSARLTYKGSLPTDSLQKAMIYRRDLSYHVEYATVLTQTNMTIGGTLLNTTLQTNSVTQPPLSASTL